MFWFGELRKCSYFPILGPTGATFIFVLDEKLSSEKILFFITNCIRVLYELQNKLTCRTKIFWFAKASTDSMRNTIPIKFTLANQIVEVKLCYSESKC